jgi:hypothetical protein
MPYKQFSSDGAHKLQAALVASRNVEVPQPKRYFDACMKWYGALPQTDRTIADIAVDAFVTGDSERAHRLANLLPAAPSAVRRS